MATTRVTLHAGICGPIWWPIDETFGKPLNARLTRKQPLYDELADLLNDGDFQSARLMADSWIEIEHSYQQGETWITRMRVVEIGGLPSLADLVDTGHYMGDFADEN